ncbi:glutamate--cysteine ligase family protein [Geomesophilobacter sediminis]|uniref:Uncharacterized protein n=1 Tax=Geomesophilobacter sediminis TaxID=2798584 RepID=A0A8J7M1U9_9BACT|nr:hypothetical protein [Geomesophilobacter sediminis]MBJ6727107.1 hypothetical protein [Geomesophilobacter sediminis]
MQPYQMIFPDAAEPIMTLVLDRRLGRVPKGTYRFVECYCTHPGCDCRKVSIFVLDGKARKKALISFGFDSDEPLAGPMLDLNMTPAPYAEELLEMFVEMVNTEHSWLRAMYRRYKAVWKKFTGVPYAGKPFPRPGMVMREPVYPGARAETAVEGGGNPLWTHSVGEGIPPASITATLPGIRGIFEEYLRSDPRRNVRNSALQDRLRRYLLEDTGVEEEFAKLLAEQGAQLPSDQAAIDAAMILLEDTLELLRCEIERDRPQARQALDQLQHALARHVFREGADPYFCAAVSHAVLHSRIEVLPVLLEANTNRMVRLAEVSGVLESSEDEAMEGISRSIAALGLSSPFEGIEILLQIFALGQPEMQINITAKLLGSESALIRDIAALMLFHPRHEVRLGVSRMLAEGEGEKITGETLRRLIVSRNWLPVGIRKNVDVAIANARRARVECARLPMHPDLSVYASTIDGSGAQSFQVITPNGRGFLSSALLLKQGVGVADAFVLHLKNRRELKEFLGEIKRQAFFVETPREYLDHRVCQALSDGARQGSTSSFWLVHIAELLGCDQWRAVGFNARRDLEGLGAEIGNASAKGGITTGADALADSANWPALPFAHSWFEDDAALEREIAASQKKKAQLDPSAAVARILDGILEKKRGVWLERLTLAAGWLKASKNPPLPWSSMYHVACAVADETMPLSRIPLFIAIAERSFAAYLGRRQVC